MTLGYKFAGQYQMRWLGALAIALSVVVIGFYLRRPAIDCNYGGRNQRAAVGILADPTSGW